MSTFWRDLIERAVATYVEAFLGLLIAGWTTAIDIKVVQAAAIAAIPAGLAVIKAAAASKKGDTISPASLATK